MLTMNIESMEAGRNLDVLVAEKVMGWTRYPEKMHPTDNRTIDGVLYCPPDFPYDRNAANVVPYFSTDIAAAWQVFAKFNYISIANVGGDYQCKLLAFKDKNTPERVDVIAGTAPLAICKAALKAMALKEQQIPAPESPLPIGEGRRLLERIYENFNYELAEIERAGNLNPSNLEAKDISASMDIVHRLIYGDVPAILTKNRWA
jgi:hypothetical protein